MASPSAKRRARPNWKQRAPERYGRILQPRQQYELTEAEWVALGGTPEPEAVQGPVKTGPATRVHGAPVPTFQPDCAQLWADVADRLGVVHLSINWPNPHDRAITAEPK